MATITLPTTPNPASMTWKLVYPSQTNVSPYTGARQVLGSNRGWWECTVEYPPIVGASNISPWRSFIAQMRGQVNTFQLPVDPTAQSSASASPLVNGANQTGRSIVCDAWPASATTLTAGQYVTINNQLLQLTADVTADGSGNATLSIEPPVRSAPADNAAIEFKNPFALMYLIEEPTLSVGIGDVYSLSLTAREAF
jgi:hypothetical protein